MKDEKQCCGNCVHYCDKDRSCLLRAHPADFGALSVKPSWGDKCPHHRHIKRPAPLIKLEGKL